MPRTHPSEPDLLAVIERDALLDAFDRARTAVLVVTGDAKVLLANRAGRDLLRAADGLVADRGRLRTALPATTRALHQSVAGAYPPQMGGWGGGGGGGGGVYLLLERPSGRRPLQALVTPATRHGVLDVSRAQGIALLLITDPEAALAPGDGTLRALYRLTPAEARVATALANGRTTGEIAAALALTKETIRSYVKQVLNKTACRSRSELVRLLARLFVTPP